MFSLRLSNTIKHTVLYGFSIALMKGISLIMLPFIAHYLSPTEFGKLEILSSLAVIGSILVGMGLEDALYRFSGQAKTETERKQYAAHIFTMTLLLALITFIISLLITPVLASLLPGQLNQYDILLVLSIIALEGMIAVPLAWLRMQDRAGLFFFTTTGRALTQAGLVLLFLKQDASISAIFEASLIAALLQAVVLSYLHIKDTGFSLPKVQSLKILNYSYPILISGLVAFALTGLDRLIIAEYAQLQDVAEYGIAFKFAIAVVLLLQPYNMWWSAKRFEVLSQDNGPQKASHFITIGLVLLAIISLGVSLTAPYVISVLLPETYINATQLVVLITLSMAFKEAAELVNIGCFTGNNTLMQMWINSAAALIGVVLMLWLVPILGVWGAIYGLLFAQSFRFVAFLTASQSVIKLPYPWFSILSFMGITALFLILSSSQEALLLQFIFAFIGSTLLSLIAFKLKLLRLKISPVKTSATQFKMKS